MVQWLYRYVFRGIGILFLVGILTGLYLMMNAGRNPSHGRSAATKGVQP